MNKVNLCNLHQAKTYLAGVKWDVFIASASFEERCVQIAELLDPSEARRIFVLANGRFAPQLESNRARLHKHFHGAVEAVRLHNSDPVASADALVNAISAHSAGPHKRILVDITTITHEHLLILLRVLHDLTASDCHIEFAYVGANEYSVGLPDAEKWLSQGVRQVRSVLGYPGTFRPSRGVHFIGLMGFEAARMRRMIEVCEPAHLSLGFSRDETSNVSKHAEVNRHFHRLVTDHYPDVHTFVFSAKDPWDTQKALEKVIRSRVSENIVVAPLNTKISTVGAGLKALELQGIQLIYAEADSYNYAGYSRPGDKFYFFTMPPVRQNSEQLSRPFGDVLMPV